MKVRLLVSTLIVVGFFWVQPPRAVVADTNPLPYYYLPFDSGATKNVSQGNNTGSHTGLYKYAWDFGGGGWLVRVARAGKVTSSRDDSSIGGCDISYLAYANFVIIDTKDGYETGYFHLAGGSVHGLIFNGELVDRYMGIGITDTTGYACGPHLHYQVEGVGSSQSVPSSFVDPTGPNGASIGVPVTNQNVVSGNFPQQPRVAVASGSPNRIDFFVKGTDQGIWHRYQDSVWHDWESLGSVPGSGYFVGEASATSWGTSRLDVFAINGDGNLWHRYWDGTGWQPPAGWENLGNGSSGSEYLFGTPSAAAWGVNHISVFARDSQGAVKHCHYDGSRCNWDPSHGMWLPTNPYAVSAAPSSVDVFVLGTQGTVWHQSWSAATGWLPSTPGPPMTNWESWGAAPNGSAFVSQPTATFIDSAHRDVFDVAADGTLWTKHYNGSTWAGWQLMGNPSGSVIIGSAAAVDSPSSPGIWSVFVRDSTGAAWNCWWNGSSCSWESHGGVLTSETATISLSPNYQLDLFVRGTDSAVWHQEFIAPGPWFSWESLGGVMT